MRHISGLPPAIGLVALAFSVAGSAPAADPVAPPPKPDWAGLESRMVAGDYAAAVTAADAIVELVRPKPRAPDFLPRSIELTRALMRRGLANLRLGDLDAAEESFTEAYRIFKDKDFQRLVSLQARQATPAIAAKLLQLELDWLELLEIRTAMLAERLRHATLARSAGDGDISPEELRPSPAGSTSCRSGGRPRPRPANRWPGASRRRGPRCSPPPTTAHWSASSGPR